VLAVVQINQKVWWYFARAGGLVAWALLAASVIWGLIYAGRLTRKVPSPAWNLDIHRFLGGLSVIFVIIHVAALWGDRKVNFGLFQDLVPFASHWRPGAMAWGVVALYLVVAIEVTSLAMRWLPRKVWRAIHTLSVLLFVFSTLHAIQAGTDMVNRLVVGVGLGLLTAVLVTLVLRLVQHPRRAHPRIQVPAVARPFDPAVRTLDDVPGDPAVRTVDDVSGEPAVRTLVDRPGGAAPAEPARRTVVDVPAGPAPVAWPLAARQPKVPRFAEPPPAQPTETPARR